MVRPTRELGPRVVLAHGLGSTYTGQVDSLSFKDAIVAATTANITIATDLNVGDTIDGITLADGDRVLVKDQTAAEENGIYVAGATPERATDMDQSNEILGTIATVIGGTVNGGTTWRVTNTLSTTIDVDDINWEEFGSASPADVAELMATVFGYLAHGNLGSTETFDATAAGWHSGVLNAACTFTLTAYASGTVTSLFLELTQDGTGGWAITLPSSVVNKTELEADQDTTASGTTLLVLLSRDGGTTWYGGWWGESGTTIDPSTTVEDETTFGITPAVGTDTEYARQDHTHGTPDNPLTGSNAVGPILITDTPAGSPLVFADLLQNEAGTDLIYADI